MNQGCRRKLSDPELRNRTIATALSWSGIRALPVANEEISKYDRNDAAFTGDYAIEFDAPKQVVANWLASEVLTLKDVRHTTRADGTDVYSMPPQKKALYAGVEVSKDGTHVRIFVVWS